MYYEYTKHCEYDIVKVLNPPSPELVRTWNPANAGFTGDVGETCFGPDGRLLLVVGNDSNGRRPVTSCTVLPLLAVSHGAARKDG